CFGMKGGGLTDRDFPIAVHTYVHHRCPHGSLCNGLLESGQEHRFRSFPAGAFGCELRRGNRRSLPDAAPDVVIPSSSNGNRFAHWEMDGGRVCLASPIWDAIIPLFDKETE